jgi:hypothetical protein
VGFSNNDLKGIDADKAMEFADTSADNVADLVGIENVKFVKGYFPDTQDQIPMDACFAFVQSSKLTTASTSPAARVFGKPQKFCEASYARVAELVLGSPPPPPRGWSMAPHCDQHQRQLAAGPSAALVPLNATPTLWACSDNRKYVGADTIELRCHRVD